MISDRSFHGHRWISLRITDFLDHRRHNPNRAYHILWFNNKHYFFPWKSRSHHPQDFGDKNALYKMGAEMPECKKSEAHQSGVIKGNFGPVCNGRDWFYGSFSHHRWNLVSSLVSSLWFLDQVAINGVVPFDSPHHKQFWGPKSDRTILTLVFWEKRQSTHQKISAKGWHVLSRILHAFVGWCSRRFEAVTPWKAEP